MNECCGFSVKAMQTVAELLQEHGLIRQMLAVMTTIKINLENGSPPPIAALEKAIIFSRLFAVESLRLGGEKFVKEQQLLVRAAADLLG